MRIAIVALLAAAVSAVPAPGQVVDRDLKSCNNNPALSIISILKASPFCTSFLAIRTRTATATQLVTSTTTQTASATVTATAPAVTVVNTVTTGVLVTSTVTSVQTATTTTTTTVVSAVRNGGPLKKREAEAAQPVPPPRTPEVNIGQLKSFASSVISTACNCYVTTPTVTATATSTVLATLQTAVIVTATVTNPNVLTTVTATTTGTTTTTTTSTTTATVTATQTSSPAYNFVNSYNSNCVPYNYLTLDANIAVNSYEEIFQFCAAKCQADSSCVELWVSYNTPAGAGRYWCLTGGGPDFKTWDSSEIQCQYPPIGQYANWYARV